MAMMLGGGYKVTFNVHDLHHSSAWLVRHFTASGVAKMGASVHGERSRPAAEAVALGPILAPVALLAVDGALVLRRVR